MEYDEYDGALDEYHRFELFVKEREQHIVLCNKAADPCGEGFSLPYSLLNLYLVLSGEYASDGRHPYYRYKQELMAIVETSYCVGASDTLKKLRTILQRFAAEDPSAAEGFMQKYGCSFTLDVIFGSYYDLATETYDTLYQVKENRWRSQTPAVQFLTSIQNEIDKALSYYDFLPFVYWTCAYERAEKLRYVDNSWWEKFSYDSLAEELEAISRYSEEYTEQTRYYLDLAIRNIQFIGIPYMPVLMK